MKTSLNSIIVGLSLILAIINTYDAYIARCKIEDINFKINLERVCSKTKDKAYLQVIKYQDEYIESKLKPGDKKPYYFFR